MTYILDSIVIILFEWQPIYMVIKISSSVYLIYYFNSSPCKSISIFFFRNKNQQLLTKYVGNW